MSGVLTSKAIHSSFDLASPDIAYTKEAIAKSISGATERFDLFRARAQQHSARWVNRRNSSIVLLIIGAHLVVIAGYLRSQDTAPIPVKKKEVVIEFVKPIVPEQKIEPPKPLPQKQKVEPNPQPVKPTPALKTPPADQPVKADDIVVQENTAAPKTPEPVAAVPTPPPAPPAPKEEPITEAQGYAGYLNNPAPEYPAFAQRQGWEGKVVLKVRVLANGKPGSIEVKQTSGRKTLDEAALEVVKGWVFAPAKRGDTSVDGWATVPIEFKLASR